jgi:hypothetical protein
MPPKKAVKQSGTRHEREAELAEGSTHDHALPQPTMSESRRAAAAGAVLGVAHTFAVPVDAAQPAAAAAATASEKKQSIAEAEAVRALTKEFPDAIVVEEAEFTKHSITGAGHLRVALLCKSCLRCHGNKALYHDPRRQVKPYVARIYAYQAREHFLTCQSAGLVAQVDANAATEQLAMVEEVIKTPMRTPLRSTPVKTGQHHEEALALLTQWMIRHNVTQMAVTDFGKSVAPMLAHDLPATDWSRRFAEAAAASLSGVMARVVREPYTCLAFDGGSWPHDGTHMLVCVASNPSGTYVLPPPQARRRGMRN